jgi:phage recombination protein Bet
MATEKTETKTAEKTAPENGVGAEVQGTRTPLARVVPVSEDRADIFNPKRWTSTDVETIKNTLCPKGIPDADFKLFIMRCQASGMNPLLGEAFCIERPIKVGGTKDNPIWGKAYVFTPGEQGMEARADDFPDYRGLRAAAVYSKDKIIIDPSTGEVSHQYNPAEDRGRLVGAWAMVYREGRTTPVEFVRLEEYSDPRNPKWSTSPHTMIVKCARAAALRRAYPNAFNGVFVREEMREEVEQLLEENTPRSTADVLADRMKATGAAQAEIGSKPATAPTKASTATVDVVKQPAKTPPADRHLHAVTTDSTGRMSGQAGPSTTTADPVVAEAKLIIVRCEALMVPYDGQKLLEDKSYREALSAELDKQAKRAAGAFSQRSMEGAAQKPPVEDEGPVMIFGGEYKNKAIRKLDGPTIIELMKLGNEKLKSLDEKRAAKVNENLAWLKAELDRRAQAMLDEQEKAQEKPQREPGDDID